jgi:hypothetical protein
VTSVRFRRNVLITEGNLFRFNAKASEPTKDLAVRSLSQGPQHSSFLPHPREIEEVLYRHPGIAEASVIGVPDQLWIERVHAVIVLKEGWHATEDEIIEFCKLHLARYKAPKSVEFVEFVI